MVEANPSCEEELKKLQLPYDIIALSNEEKVANFFIEKTNQLATGASFYKEKTDWYSDGNYETISIPTVTLDSRNYFPDEKIDLIKLDVQGSEFDIISGGKKTLERTDYVIMELSLIEYNENAPTRRQVIEKMLENNFCMIEFLEYRTFRSETNCFVFQMDMLFKNMKNS